MGNRDEDRYQPLVTIISPVYNESLYIMECIDSVLGQTYRNFEWIIIDDHSTDDTYSMIKAIDDERVVVLRNESKGKVAAFNAGFRASMGNIFVLLAGDDVLPKNSISTRVEGFSTIDSVSGRYIIRGHLKTISEDKKYDGVVVPRYKQGNLSGGGIGFTRGFAEQVFPIPVQLPNEDTWIKLNADYLSDEIMPSRGIVLFYRIHSGNSSSSRRGYRKASEAWAERAKVYKIFLEKYSERLDGDGVDSLRRLCELERRRENGEILGILFMFKVGLLTRLRVLSLAHPFAYRLRSIGWRWVTGLLR